MGRSRLSLTTADSKRLSDLIDVNRSSDRDHRIEALDVLVAHAHAAVAHGLPDCLGVIRAVDAVAIAKLETARSQHAHVSPGGSAVRWNDDVAIHDDLLSFDAST